ncbi:UBX domain-containing protein 1 [Dermatophagoides pteronyssinus]|uniref:UBX domain-containing protein 1 n=1 Tax=Dermatophagoides pteronyssinus TaxID=6956 RepID=A0ABQ8J4P4_DERPT|nr:UBX domain-containing protein 1 [Dermatophagoides pteronyssinus]
MASHAVLKEQLIEMGFEENLINGALKLLKENATLESVIESIDNGTAEEAVKTLTENDQKSESKDKADEGKTPEEIEAKKKAYAEKIKQRRAEMDEKEKEAERFKELQRRREGKDMGKVRDELQRKQQENYIESLKREKDEEKAARDKILKQIELDKAERRARAQGIPTGANPSTSPAVITPSKPSLVSTASKTGKTKLAIRLLDGTQVVEEFDDKEVLSAVRAYIVTQKNIDFNITFTMPLRPPFTEEDMTKSLFVLGLSPNARLQVVKRTS